MLHALYARAAPLTRTRSPMVAPVLQNRIDSLLTPRIQGVLAHVFDTGYGIPWRTITCRV